MEENYENIGYTFCFTESAKAQKALAYTMGAEGIPVFKTEAEARSKGDEMATVLEFIVGEPVGVDTLPVWFY